MHNLKNTWLFAVVLLFHPLIHAQNFTIPLWPAGEIPNHLESDNIEIRDTTEIVRISNVQVPDIAVFLPSKRSTTGQAVVICPGGGYRILAYDWEGMNVGVKRTIDSYFMVKLKTHIYVKTRNLIYRPVGRSFH